MQEKLMLIGALILVIIYWFRDDIKFFSLKTLLIGVYSFLGGIFVASFILWILRYLDINNTNIYGALIGPLIEEVSKFVIIYYIISTLDKDAQTTKVSTSIGILVGLGFGIYENLGYIKGGIDDIWNILFRSILIGGVMLHPMISGIYGYLIHKAGKLEILLPDIFGPKKDFKSFLSIGGVIKLIYNGYSDTREAIFKILDFIKRILILDITITYILSDKTESISGYGHAPIEIVVEGLMLGIYLHTIYNSILTYINMDKTLGSGNTEVIIIQIFGVIISLMLVGIFNSIFASKTIGRTITLIIGGSFLLKSQLGDSLSLIGLVMIILCLIILSIRMNNKLNVPAALV